MKKRGMVVVALLIVACVAMAGCGTPSEAEKLRYEGKTYVPVTFSQDVFCCSLGVAGVFEEDVTYSIEHDQFDMIHNSGDLYVVESQRDAAASYYQDDVNYDWEICIFSEEGDDVIKPVQVSAAELKYIYQIEQEEKDLAIFFEDIEQQVTLIKTSKDGVVRGSIELALYDGQWYWRTEIIDETQEKDGSWAEYIVPMPESFQNKIKL